MKKNLFAIIALVAMAFGFYSCEPSVTSDVTTSVINSYVNGDMTTVSASSAACQIYRDAIQKAQGSELMSSYLILRAQSSDQTAISKADEGAKLAKTQIINDGIALQTSTVKVTAVDTKEEASFGISVKVSSAFGDQEVATHYYKVR